MCALVSETFFNSQTPVVMLLLLQLCVSVCVPLGQVYLEELVKQEGEPVGEHLLSNRLSPGRPMKENGREKGEGNG